MFDETLSSRVARLAEAEAASREMMDRTTDTAATDAWSVRKLALLKVEQALLIAGF